MKYLKLFITILSLVFVAAGTASAQERYAYDGAGRLASVTYEDLSRIDYTYDANGNILSMKAGVASVPRENSGRDAIAIAVSPNPVAGSMRISVTLARASRIAVDVLSIDGNVVATVHDDRSVDHVVERDWDAAVLAEGTYALRVRATGVHGNEVTQIRKFTIVR